MARKGGTGAWAAEDMEDWDDDYDDDDEYDAYDDHVAPRGAKGSHGHKAAQASTRQAPVRRPHAPAAAAGASAMARAISDPPPPRGDGRPQRGGTSGPGVVVHQARAYPLAPAAAVAAAADQQQQQRFDFSTPSPDDRAKAAGPAGRPTVGISLAPSKTPTVKQQQQLAQARRSQAAAPALLQQQQDGAVLLTHQHSIDEALHDLDALQLQQGEQYQGSGGGAVTGVASRPGLPLLRPLAEYTMEQELAMHVDAALATEASLEHGRRGLHLIVMGHVDAGKSTLMGRLMHDLGHISQKEAHRNQRDAAAAGKASFSWAWVLDERPEERARGVTVDVAIARFVTPNRNVTLLDAPGHRDFVPNMIGGAAQADAALLLVDGSPGGFESGFNSGSSSSGSGECGQTREHAQLARSLGVEQLAVVVSKLDMCGYSAERFQGIQDALGPFLRSVGFKDSCVQWLPAVGPTGENLTAPPTEPALAAWWRGPTLVQAIDAFVPRQRNTGTPLRLTVHDVCRARSGGGVVVGGKLEGGALRPGSKVMVVPGYELATVKALEVDGQDHAPLAMAGDSADVALSGIDVALLRAGCVLCHPSFPVQLAARFTARVLVLQVAVPLLKGAAVTVHVHAAREAGVVSALLGLVDPRTGERTGTHKPRCLLSGQTALVEVTPVRPLALELFSDVKSLGRLALREGGRTLAVGIIVQVMP